MKKYRTKSGTVEEKLPGVNATVNPSEKTQIAMAGGANTLKDVQTILGQEGKRNNLKGQGAKHLVSFFDDTGGYEGMDDPAGTPGVGGFGSPSSASTGGGVAGGMGGQDDPDPPTGPDTFGGKEVGPGFGQEEDEWGVSLKETPEINIRAQISRAQQSVMEEEAEDPWDLTRTRAVHVPDLKTFKKSREAHKGTLTIGIQKGGQTTKGYDVVQQGREDALATAVAAEAKAMGLGPIGEVDEGGGEDDENILTQDDIQKGISYAKATTEIDPEDEVDRMGGYVEYAKRHALGAVPGISKIVTYAEEGDIGYKGPAENKFYPREFAGDVAAAVLPLIIPGAGALLGEVAREVGSSAAKSARQRGYADPTNVPDTPLISQTGGYGMAKVGIPSPPPPPDELDGGNNIPKKKKLTRSAANNTTLAIAEEGDFTRAQIRRARRQITRFA
jgi:hypothetical protein